MFELTQQTATLAKVTNRTERHGDVDVPAVSLHFTITGANSLLDTLSPGLLDLFYKPAEEPDVQQQIEGTELTAKPKLRVAGIDEVKFRGTLEGWTVRIDYGIDDSSAIVSGGCKVDGFSIDELLEGGSCTWSLRVGTSDVNEATYGKLGILQKREVSLTIKAPVVKIGDQGTIDGTVDSFLKDHPGAGQADMLGGPNDKPDGGDDGGSDGEGSDPDLTPESALAAAVASAEKPAKKRPIAKAIARATAEKPSPARSNPGAKASPAKRTRKTTAEVD